MEDVLTLKDYIASIALYAVPVVSIVLTYIVGRVESTHGQKINAYKEAYENLYVPFIRMLYEKGIWYCGFANLSCTDQIKFYSLLVENIQYMDSGILKVFQPFCYDFASKLLEQSGIGDTFCDSSENADGLFTELVEKMLCRAQWLSRKLHLPGISLVALQEYRDGVADREKLLQKSGQ